MGRAYMTVVLVGLGVVHGAWADQPREVKIWGEQIEFKAKSNLSAIEINGRSKVSSGTAMVWEEGGRLNVERLNLRIPVSHLSTGIGLRDSHMREKIFQTGDGQTPDISFESQKTQCAKEGHTFKCDADGLLSFRGQTRPAKVPVILSKNGENYQAKADFNIKLTDFGVTPPSHFGVSINDNVSVKASLLGKETGEVVAVKEAARAEPIKVAAIKKEKPATPFQLPDVEGGRLPVSDVASVDVMDRRPSSAETAEAHVQRLPKIETRAATGIEIQLPNGTVLRGLDMSQVMQVLQLKDR